jgi:hypothetical protein
MLSSPAKWVAMPYEVAAAERLCGGLGVSRPVGAILARRGFADADESRRFRAAVVSAAIFGFAVNGGTVPGQNDTELVQALIAIPSSAIGLAISYFWGARLDREHGIDHGFTRAGSH